MFKPMSFEWGIVMIVAIFIGTLVLLAAGAYGFLRVFANLYNSKQATWDSVAGKLGLDIDTSKQRLHKDFIGRRDGFDIRVTHYGVSRGENSSDPHASVEIRFIEPLGFSFEITKPEMTYQIVKDFFDDSQETGIEYFDKAYTVKCSDMPKLIALLNADITDAESTNLLNDAMLANKNCYRFNFTNQSITLGSRSDIGDAPSIERIIKRAVRFAHRVEQARKKV